MSGNEKGRARLAFAVGIPLLGLAELAAHLYFAARPPSFDDWRALREPVLERVRGLERPLVVVAPRWAEPLARRALGDAAFPLEAVGRSDARVFEEALEISILGERSEELEDFEEVEHLRVGEFSLRLLSNPAPLVPRYDFVAHVGPGSLDVRTTDPAAVCRWNPRARVMSGGLGGHPTFPPTRFECPGSPFFHVGVTVIADEAFRPRRCIWAHPPRRGELVLRFRGVPLGSVIAGRSGMYWIIERERKGAPVHLRVRVDGEEAGLVTHVDGEGFSPFEIPLGARAGKEAEVEFAVSSPNYAHRHFCFEAHTR